MTSTKRTCVNCGAPVTGGGRPTQEGRYFCMGRPCRAARQREVRQVANGMDPGEIEDRPCSSCGCEIGIRPARITDLSIGRWCMNPGCRKERTKALIAQRVINKAPMDQDRINVAFNEAKWRGRVHCAACGSDTAVAGFAHPKPGPEFDPCWAFGRMAPDDDIVMWSWLRFCPDDEERERRVEVLTKNGRDPVF